MGSVRSLLIMARLIVGQLDIAQEAKTLSDDEIALHRELKHTIVGLASLSRMIARQRSCIGYLCEGDANAKFFHLQVCHRKRKGYIPTFEILGTYFTHARNINLAQIGMLQLDLSELAYEFTEDEVWAVVREIPND